MRFFFLLVVLLLTPIPSIAESDQTWWEALPETTPGFRESDLFGSTYTRFAPWFWTSHFGWLYILDHESGYWLWHLELGWIWIHRGDWPFMYIWRANAWFYLFESSFEGGAPKAYDYRFEREVEISEINLWAKLAIEGERSDLRLRLENSHIILALESDPEDANDLAFHLIDSSSGNRLGRFNNHQSNIGTSYRADLVDVSREWIEIRYLKTHRFQQIRLYEDWDLVETQCDHAFIGTIADSFVDPGDTADHILFGAEEWLADRQLVNAQTGLNKSALLPQAPDYILQDHWAPLESLSYNGHLIYGAVDEQGEGVGVVLKDQNIDWLLLERDFERRESGDMLSWYFSVPSGGKEALFARGKRVVDEFIPWRNALMGIQDYYANYPQSGEVFREYIWNHPGGDAGGALRVGGQAGVSYPDRGSNFGYINTAKTLNHEVDLDHAIRAEVIIEKVLSHDRTTGFGIEVNGHDWIYPQDPLRVPEPTNEYYHQIFQTIPIPLDNLKSGWSNRFRLRVDAQHPWGWPQHLVYGVHFRVYYDPAQKEHPTGRITAPLSGEGLGERVALSAQASSPTGTIDRIEFLGLYEGVNCEGDGVYRQWHHYYFQGALKGILASDGVAPFQGEWETSWIPDQSLPMQIVARIVDDNGLVYMTETVDNLTFDRTFGVELAKPYDVPIRWVTRTGSKEERFFVRGDLSKATSARLAWTSWSPGYMRGVYVNNRLVIYNEGPFYSVFNHEVDWSDVSFLRPGDNTLRTNAAASTSVHGMEVMWPGIQVLIRYAE